MQTWMLTCATGDEEIALLHSANDVYFTLNLQAA